MPTQAAKATTSTIRELETRLSDISQLTTEAVACCQLSSLAVEATIARLKARLLAEQPNLRVYTALGGSLDSLGSPFDASSFSMTLPSVADVHANALQLEATLRRSIDYISCLPTLHDSSSDITSAKERTDEVLATLDKETQTLSKYFLSLSSAFHDFWKERLMLHTGPSTANIANNPPSVVIARAAQKIDSLVDDILTSTFEKYRSESYASLGGAWPHINPSLDSAINGVVSEVLAWATSREATPIAHELTHEVFQLICEHLWSSRLFTLDADLAKARAELEPDSVPVTTTAAVLSALLQTQIVRSRMCSHLVVPIGATGSGKDSLINALIGTTVLPPRGLQTAFPCRIRHQQGLTDPILTIPRPAFLAALNCLRKAQPSKRRAAFDAMKDRNLADPATKALMEKFERLHMKSVVMLESPEYDIPETVKGLVSVRRLLNDLNALGRACRSLGIPFNLPCVEWPIVSVDFQSLHESPDSWEFWSVPGEYSASGLPDDVEYFNRAIEYHADIVAIVNYQQRMVDVEWVDFPSRLRSAQATMVCVLGTWTDRTAPGDSQEFQAELGREFFNDSLSPRALLCELRWGPCAAALLRLFRRSGGKPPYSLISLDPESFEYIFLGRPAINALKQEAYDDTPLIELEEQSTQQLETSQLGKTLQNLVQWIPQSTRQSIQESMRLIITRCSELEKEIDAILGSGILVMMREREQEERSSALLACIKTATEANIDDAHEILHELHDQFANNIAAKLHLAILLCVEAIPPIPPAPSQVAAEQHEFLLSGIDLVQLMGRIDERLQGALDDLSQELAQDLGNAFEYVAARELAALSTDQATALGIVVAPFHERFRLDSKLPNMPPTPTLDEQHCAFLRPESSIKTLFKDCRRSLPLIGKRPQYRILSPFTALLAVFPFLFRWPELLRDTPPSYRVSIPRLEKFYLDNLTTPWKNDVLKVVDSTIETSIKEVWRAVEEARSKLNADNKQDYLRRLLAAKGSLHFAVAMLPHLLGDVAASEHINHSGNNSGSAGPQGTPI